MNLLNKRQWKILNALRSGYGLLNGQLKYGKSVRNCMNNECKDNLIEDTTHYLLDCIQYKIERNILFNKVNYIYNIMDFNFNNLDKILKLKCLVISIQVI